MEGTFCSVLLLLSLSQTFGKYVYVNEQKTWPAAQRHCRLFYTDLAAPGDKHDMNKLQEDNPSKQVTFAWIGLTQSSTNPTVWMWSGGGNVTTFFWAHHEPDNGNYKKQGGAIYQHLWYDFSEIYSLPFFCYRAIVVREKKTWEEALDHCRKHHRDLASVASDTEMLLIQGELRKSCTTERVWIGLHFLPDRWLWVDRQPLGYRAWGGGGTEACPAGRCAAIQLPVGKTRGDEPFSNCSDVPQNPGPLGNWVPLNCRERLHFICY